MRESVMFYGIKDHQKGKCFLMGLDAIKAQIEYIESMFVEIDTEYIADVIIIRKESDIRIGAGVSLTLIGRESIHIEPGVIVRSVGAEGKSGSDDSRGHCTTNTDRDGGGVGDGQVGYSGTSAGNFIICTTHLEFEQDMERFFHVALVGGKGGAGGKGGKGGLFWLNLVESAENRRAVEKISPPILTGGEAANRGSDDDGEHKITFSSTFSDVMKRLTDEG